MLTIIKIGGNVLDDTAELSRFVADFARVPEPKILVHGGGKIASEIGKKLGIEPIYHDGRRITDGATLELVTMVYGGLINKKLAAQLQFAGCNAIGLTGADASLLPANKRAVKEIDYGFVGDVNRVKIDGAKILGLCSLGLVPVFAPLTYDGMGGLLNTNADTIAQELARALSLHGSVQLVYCFEKAGVLANANDESSVISQIGPSRFEQLKESNIVSGGMIPKIENALNAVAAGVQRVVIGKSNNLLALCAGKSGTIITNP